MNLSELSPKVYVPVIFAVLAAVALWLLTGDKTFLVSILVSLAAGGAGVAARPAPLLTQREVNAASRKKQRDRLQAPPPGPPDPPQPPRHRPVA